MMYGRYSRKIGDGPSSTSGDAGTFRDFATEGFATQKP